MSPDYVFALDPVVAEFCFFDSAVILSGFNPSRYFMNLYFSQRLSFSEANNYLLGILLLRILIK